MCITQQYHEKRKIHTIIIFSREIDPPPTSAITAHARPNQNLIHPNETQKKLPIAKSAAVTALLTLPSPSIPITENQSYASCSQFESPHQTQSSPFPLTPFILTAPMASPHHHGADDDTDFDEYNPHPYQGGYDIALTYGRPRPPSSATCYPIDVEPTHRPDPTPPPVAPSPESRHLPEPKPGPGPEPYTPPSAYDYGGESRYRPLSHDWADLDVFGFWPFVSERWGGRFADVEEVGYWSQWKRAGDYLFGYSEGFGERRIGVDSFGIPIYANKMGIGEAVTVQIEPARDLTVDHWKGDSVSAILFPSSVKFGLNLALQCLNVNVSRKYY